MTSADLRFGVSILQIDRVGEALTTVFDRYARDKMVRVVSSAAVVSFLSALVLMGISEPMFTVQLQAMHRGSKPIRSLSSS